MIRYLELEAMTSKLHLTNSAFYFFAFFQKFLCGGRLVFGPDVASLFLTTLLIAGPAITFCVKIYLKIKDGSHDAQWYPVLIVGLILAVLVNILDSLFLD